jgi:beta-galactosidase
VPVVSGCPQPEIFQGILSMTAFSRRDVLRSGFVLSASALVASSAKARAEALIKAMEEFATQHSLLPRERTLLNFGWKFFQGNGNDPSKDLGFGHDQGEFSKSGNFYFSKTEMDDSKWRSLDLPHDWAVELPFVNDDALKGHGYKPLGRAYPETSVGWYRRKFEIPKEDKGRRIVVEFDGAFRSALVFVNGFFIGRNDNGYCPFQFDISDFLNYGGKNAIVVRMDASFGDGWFYEGAGIYRHVWLRKTDPVHFGAWDSYVRTQVNGDVTTLELSTVVKNDGDEANPCRVRWTILDAEKKTVASVDSAVQTVGADGSVSFTASAKLAHAAMWSPETPVLYSAVVKVESAGKTLDAEQVSFGVRTIRFDADKGFFLNGKYTKIKGTCNHQDHAGVGAALPDALQWYRLSVLKAMGSNAVRTSHNMPTPEWVEACDRMGMMMLCETRMMSSTPEGLAQLETMIKRFRNSPAIIAWSMGNEEWPLQSQPMGEPVVHAMVRRSHELDPTRMCTAATTAPFTNSVSKELDIEGFNYTLGDIDRYHKEHPEKLMIGSETSSAIGTRGVYETDTYRNWITSYDNAHPSWAENAEEWWKFYAAREWLPGGFAWTGFDYRGEPTPYAYPEVSSQFGIVDMCGFPKDSYFYYKSWWGAEPVLHLFPHWNWDERFGQPVPVWVHSNLDEVELFLNGKSQGSQKVKPLTHLEWSVKYEPGLIEARGTKDGKVVLVEKRETTGKIASIKLSADRMEIDANGEDVANVRVEALDAQGRLVPTEDMLVKFRVTDEGKLIGVGNGNPNCLESDKGSERSFFNGLAQVIVQSTKNPGEITVEAYTEEWPGPKLPTATLIIKTKKAELRGERI